MKKKLIILGILYIPTIVYSQVGINTSTPVTTLAIEAKEKTGTAQSIDGILIPRIDRERAQSMINIPISTMVYISDVSTGTQTETTAQVDLPGFYYFNGNVWDKLSKTATIPNTFVPTVVVAGQAEDSFIINDSSGFNKFSFITSTNDGNWNSINNTYTIPKKGFYQLSLQSFMQPGGDNNSFAWNVKYNNNLYELKSMSNLRAGRYNSGGMIVLYFDGNEVIEFGGIPCRGCYNNYTISKRSFTITYLGT